MRLHNRMIKAAFWTDTDLLKHLDRDGRMFYIGLIQLADDSGCLEDDLLAFKIHLYPADMDIDLDFIQKYRDKLVEMGKVIPYAAEGKKCLYLKNFHKHQSLRSPAPPEVPLPPWITWQAGETPRSAGRYIVGDPYGHRTVTVSSCYGDQPEPEREPEEKEKEKRTEGGPGETKQPPQPEASADCNLPPDPEDGEKSNGDKGSQGPGTKSKSKPKRKAKNPEYTAEFEQFWQAYPQGRRLDKFATFKNWSTRLKEGLAPGDLIRAASNYAANCRAENTETRYILRPTTFLGPNRRWESWLTWVPQARDGPLLTANTKKAMDLVEKYRRLEEMHSDQSGNSNAVGTYGSGVAEI